ncbi:diaminopimelate epimerase [Buchnera aphidicola (Ceratovacuna keduensis)]|uniref:diaminopimelate epimerase n=1 Tax=Buchnera aphidicola TaxID=9 RepID=UPI0031B85AC7
MLMNFSKMHGLGNDFVLFNNINNKFIFTSSIVKKLSDRNFGIGFDQLILVEKSFNKKIDFFYKIFNSDGTEVFQCVNGVRCFGRFINLKNISKKKNIYVMTKNQIFFLKNINKDIVSVKLSEPIFDSYKIPFLKKYSENGHYILINSKKIKYFTVSLGNPHCVIFVDNILLAKVDVIGSFLEKHFLFPLGVNVNFVEIVSKKEINVRTYERGVGETKSCGSGACASVIIGIKNNFLNKNVLVNLNGGKLNIFCEKKFKNILLSGNTTHVYDGKININNFL